jgi:hypothetical protein
MPIASNETHEILSRLDEIKTLLQSSLGLKVEVPADAARAHEAQVAARLRGWFTVKEFASSIGMHPRTVNTRCRRRIIRTLRDTGRHRIPVSEWTRWNQLA